MAKIECAYLSELKSSVKSLARLAFEEDMPNGDVTAETLRLGRGEGKAQLICREPVSMCGAAWFEVILQVWCEKYPEQPLSLTCHGEDGQRMPAGSRLFTLSGNGAAILAVERTLLNFLARGIGIANATFAFVDAVKQVNQVTRILDTRKTQPGYRWFDKYAVLCGGGYNHRMNLSDQVLIKENHLHQFGDVASALAFVKQHLQRDHIGVQVEVANMHQLQQALDAKCPLIMLDNFTPEMVDAACALPRPHSQLEVSGGVNMNNLGDYCRSGPDRISTGAITHSVKAPDLSLLMIEE